jgi:integrase
MANIKERLAKDGTKRFTCDIRLKGYPPQRATFKRLTDAKKWIQDTESAIREGRHFKTIEAKKHTVADMIDRYLTGANLSKIQSQHIGLHLERWRDEIGYLLLADITVDAITQVSEKLLSEDVRGKPRSNSTVLKYMTSLNTVFNVAVKNWGWLDDSPMRNIKKPQPPNGRVRFLDDAEREKLLAACKDSKNPVLYTCVVLALATGMRQGELMGLKWQDVDLQRGVIILHETKNGERRRVSVSGLALELLLQHLKIRRIDTALLFPSKIKPQQPVELKKAWQTALKKAEIDDFHWHDLRHCTASYLAMNGASLAEIAEVLGHKTLSMVKRYSHLSDSHVSNVVASMNDKIFGAV